MQFAIPRGTKVLGHEVHQNGESATISIHDTEITVRCQHNENGTTTWFISNLIMWFTTSQADLEAMLVKFHTQHNWEQDPK